MNQSIFIQSQLLATKFYVPMISGPLISRTRLSSLLSECLKYPLTLISAPAGFGKTTLLSTWIQSLPANNPFVAWVSLDEEDNDPRLFWTYILSALDQQQPERFTPLFKYLQSPQTPPLMYVLIALSNLVRDSAKHFVLILDDYHLISEQQVHTTLSYLVEHLPPQLHIILATRTDPSLPISLLRTRGLLLEVRTDQLRCTTEETRTFFEEVVHIQLPDETILQVTTRTEGWLVGLYLLGLSLPESPDPATLLEELGGDQRYILSYLTEEVLRKQPQDVQTFLLSTCILERLSASLCDAVMDQHGSQQILEWLEHANLFIVSLDSQQEWYRYHALFAEALHSQLEQTYGGRMPALHYRASFWYAEHGRTTQAILHALFAKKWQWAADLIEQIPVLSLNWGASEHELTMLQHWLKQLPADVAGSRPRLCLICTQILWAVAPYPILQAWLEAAEATLTAALSEQIYQDTLHTTLSPQTRQEQEDLLGEIIIWHTFLRSMQEEDGQVILARCQQAFPLLLAQNVAVHSFATYTQSIAFYFSSTNNALAAIQSGLQAGLLAQTAGYTSLAISITGMVIWYMIGAGHLHEAHHLIQQAFQMKNQHGEPAPPKMSWLTLFQAEILREWNQLDAALSLVLQAIGLHQQAISIESISFSLYGYAILLRIHLSRGDYDAARSALQQVEHIGQSMNQPSYLHLRSFFTTIDQVRLWLACGEQDRVTCWLEELDLEVQYASPFAHEREEVACVRILLANKQPTVALSRLEPVLQRATAGQRWGHVIEMRLLQALAHHMRHQQEQALSTLSEAVRLAEPEGYIRTFVDEGAPMATLLSHLRKHHRKLGPTPYLDTLLAAFPQQSKAMGRR